MGQLPGVPLRRLRQLPRRQLHRHRPPHPGAPRLRLRERLLPLPRAEHFSSVQRFHAEDIRFELRDPDVVVIDCAWNSGTVHFNDCDDTANAFKSFAPALKAHRYDLGTRGPLVRYDSCQLTGAHRFRTDGTATLPRVVRYDMCLLASHNEDGGFLAVDAGQDTGFARFTDCVTPT